MQEPVEGRLVENVEEEGLAQTIGPYPKAQPVQKETIVSQSTTESANKMKPFYKNKQKCASVEMLFK